MSARSSFAYNGGGDWRFYEREGVNIPMAEIREHASVIAAVEGIAARNDFIATIRLKIKRAALGKLVPPADAKTRMARRPDINELRWLIEGTHWRLYYSEPLRLHTERVMLGLRFNHKASVEQQNRDIDEASQRNVWWHANTPR
ncbi:hypothetical protein [Allokutzneria sp. NRRL B-24872]|uniref:hypothetical protein n=1 Tax=Allokutzneria sp. NRRL B-24872 TaxID=1137961 RepID=UPI00143D489F|nr:hypothetical protein [Allokutzneria sp. NRRL B-24872]